ncbi:MAG: hypothetical protein JNM93_00055 [Bacteriovoracaceae bacterium]|nr:hypothetical protein [Bacteriovoracaceae bacterium]
MMKFLNVFAVIGFLTSSLAQAQSQKLEYSGVFYDSASGQYFVNDKPMFSIRSLSGTDFLDRIEYSLNDEDFKLYSSQLQFKQEGLHLLRFKAVDPVNNWSPVQSFRIYVDLTKPRSQVSWFGEYYQNNEMTYVGPNAQLVISGSDNLSGISKTLMKASDDKVQVYTAKKNFSSPGVYKINYASIDNVGNKEEWVPYQFTVDTSTPKTQAKLSGDVFQVKDKIYTNLGALIQLESEDEGSGVKEIEYRINNSLSSKYEDKFAIDKKLSKLLFRGVDRVGNQEGWKEFTVHLDTEAPDLNVDKQGNFHQVSGKIFATMGLKLTASAADKDSGLKNFLVNAKEVPLSNQGHMMSFNEEGNYEVTFSAIDNVGNKANPKTYSVVIDQTPPTSSFDSSVSMVMRNEVFFTSIPNVINITGRDEGVGLKHIELSYDGRNYTKLNGSIDLATWQEKERTIYYRAVDQLGNIEMPKKMRIAIKDKGPSVGLFVETNELGNLPLSQVKNNEAAEEVQTRMPASVETEAKPAAKQPAAKKQLRNKKR